MVSARLDMIGLHDISLCSVRLLTVRAGRLPCTEAMVDLLDVSIIHCFAVALKRLTLSCD